MKTNQPIISLLCTCLALTAPYVQAFTFIEDDFSSPDYNFTSISQPDLADFSTSNFTDFTLGGNPTFYRNIMHEHEVERDEDTGVPTNGTGVVQHQSLLRETNDTYLPSSEGTIDLLNFSIDLRSTRSAGLFFFFDNSLGSGYAGGFTSFTGSPGWQTITVSLLQGDFSFGADFASTSPLRFGFGFSSTDNVTAGPTSYSFDVDNFRLNIIPVPEPSAALFAALGSLALFQHRRRSYPLEYSLQAKE